MIEKGMKGMRQKEQVEWCEGSGFQWLLHGRKWWANGLERAVGARS